MKTYAESVGKDIFDWNEFVDRDPKKIEKHEWEEVRNLSRKWKTCACGNQCYTISRYEDGTPLDYYLFNLGNIFYRKIRDKDLKGAKETLAKIEERSTELIEEILN